MTRLEKGGIRLRLITALAAVTVIAAGVYATLGAAPDLPMLGITSVNAPASHDGGTQAEVRVYLSSPNLDGGETIYLKPIPDLTGWDTGEFPSPPNYKEVVTIDKDNLGTNLIYDSAAGAYYVKVMINTVEPPFGQEYETKIRASVSSSFTTYSDSGLITIVHQ